MTAPLHTRCPICLTIFRVTEEQLGMRGGRVRCGRCQQVFDGRQRLETVVADPAGAQASRDDASSPAADATHSAVALAVAGAVGDVGREAIESPVPASATAAVLPPAVDETDTVAVPERTVTEDSAVADAGPTQAPDGLKPAERLEEEAPEVGAPDVGTPGGAAPDAAAPDTVLADATAPVIEVAEPTAPDTVRPEAGTPDGVLLEMPAPGTAASDAAMPEVPASDAAAGAAAPDDRGADSGVAGRAPQPAEASTATAGASTDAEATAASQAPAGEPPSPAAARDDPATGFRGAPAGELSRAPLAVGFPWEAREQIGSKRLWAVLVPLLALVLAAQAAWQLRHEIAARIPASKPALVAACGWLGCQVQPPRDRDRVSIESSELQSDAAHRGLLILTATLRNRADFAIAYPHLELTLTDLQDQPVARRVLVPAEYAGGTAQIDSGVPANGEVHVKLFIDASATQQQGYRLYLFYP